MKKKAKGKGKGERKRNGIEDETHIFTFLPEDY